jgi:large subunit ribosomal protein L7e
MAGKTPKPAAAKAAAKPAAAAPVVAAPKAAAVAKPAAAPAKAAVFAPAAPVKVAAPAKAAAPVVSASKTKVPESFLKKRKTGDAIKAKRDAAKSVYEKKKKATRKDIFKRAEKYVKEYRDAQRSLVRSKRQAKNNGNYFIEDMPKVLLIVRVRGIMCVAPKTKKILQLFRLLQLNSATFVKVNFATMTMLSYIEPYVTYGKPTLKTVSELIYKRGFAKVNKQRVPLTDNKIIADNLGKEGIICVEDLIHEIYTCGPNFKAANNFLWPFKLSNPLGGWKNKGIHFAEGGDAGNREEMINKLVQRMN